MKKSIITCILLLAVNVVICQNDNVIPVTVNEKFSDFTLIDNTGKNVTLSDLKGKNVMLVFIRGKVTAKTWCPICHYQYLEMVETVKKEQLEEKYNLKVFFIMPYSKDSLQSWIDAIPQSLETINRWKNPENIENITGNVEAWMKYTREFFPKSFSVNPDKFELEIPVLFDTDKKVSNGLQIFREEWGGTKVPQNVPTIFIIDKKGYVKFKYLSQYTNDRVNSNYLVKYLEKMF